MKKLTIITVISIVVFGVLIFFFGKPLISIVFNISYPFAFGEAEVSNIKIERVEFNSEGKEKVSGKYRYYTDNGVYINRDSEIHLKWDSTDVHNKMRIATEKNQTCKIYINGFRIPLISMFPNIRSVEECWERNEENQPPKNE